MKKRWYDISSLLLVFLCSMIYGTVSAAQPNWTEDKLGKLAVKADRASSRKNWSRAIKNGEQILEGAATLYSENDPEYISRLKTVNRYYDKAGRLLEIPERIIKAYNLSVKYLEPDHLSSKLSRLLYYKLLIAQKNYGRAIPLVLENISLADMNNKGRNFKKLHYLAQLYSLYGFIGQFVKQKDILLKFIALNNRLLGKDDENANKARVLLAKSYCRQRKYDQFRTLQRKYNLLFSCKKF